MLQTGCRLQGTASPGQRHDACAWGWDTPLGSTRQRRTRAPRRQRAGSYEKYMTSRRRRRRRSCCRLDRWNGRQSPRRPAVEGAERKFGLKGSG